MHIWFIVILDARGVEQYSLKVKFTIFQQNGHQSKYLYFKIFSGTEMIISSR